METEFNCKSKGKMVTKKIRNIFPHTFSIVSEKTD